MVHALQYRSAMLPLQPWTHLLLCEPLHDVRRLLPHVHRLLVLDAPLEEEQVEDGEVLDVCRLLELGAELRTERRGRDIEGVEGADLGGGAVVVSVEGAGAGRRLLEVLGDDGALRQAGGDRRHLGRVCEGAAVWVGGEVDTEGEMQCRCR